MKVRTIRRHLNPYRPQPVKNIRRKYVEEDNSAVQETGGED